jgi:hypothetical protein
MPSTPTRDLPEEFLAAMRKSQEVMIRAIKTWVETVRTVTPKLPSAYADRLPSLPSVTVPFADRLPKPEDVVASGYDFAEHLLAIQRKFAEDLLQATEPLIPANARRAWQDATKADATAAPKPAAPKPAAPKPATPAAQVTPSAPKAPAAKAAPKPAAKPAPKPAAAKPAPKAAPAAGASKPATPTSALKPATPAAPRAPKSNGTS